MTLHVRPEAGSPLLEAGRHTLGMPHLCPAGLSENWLWKELGHRHWQMIAGALGRAAAGFDPAAAEPTYAAFRGIALRGDLGGARENDVLEVGSTLAHLSGTRVVSRHRVGIGGRRVAEAEMASVFVRRRVSGLNRSLARVRIERGACPPGSEAPPRGWEAFAPGGPADGERELGSLTIEPCPDLDFNGAGLLYFSSFVAAVDRAEWRLLGGAGGLRATRERRAIFHGNIEPGENLTVRILAGRDGEGLRHRALIHAAAGGRLLAEVVTRRGASSSPDRPDR